MLLKVDKAWKKEQIASGTVKLSCAMCMVVFVGGLLDAKNAQVTSENANSIEPQKRQTSEPNEQQSDKSEQ